MATRNRRNGNLEQAIALLLQNQALFMQGQLTFAAETKKEFIAIRQELEAIKAILMRHEQMLAALPEAIRQKIGFKTR